MEAVGAGLFFIIFVLGGFAVWLYALVDVIRAPDHQYQAGTQLV